MALATPARAQPLTEKGFAGLGESAAGFAAVTPGRVFSFPRDHGPHSDFRTEWWYVTANLRDGQGQRFGAQWTLFRQATAPNSARDGWDDREIWMGHAAATSATSHRFAETLSRGGIGTAGVTASPFHAFIDAWDLEATGGFDASRMSPLRVTTAAKDFSVALDLASDRPVALQGEGGYSRKSERGQASYYYSQPFFRASGQFVLDGATHDVSGHAWLDREWSSQPLAPDQSGWDWLSLHLDSGDRLMLFRLRGTNGDFLSGNVIARDGGVTQLLGMDIAMRPLATSRVAGRELPTRWRIDVPSRGIACEVAALNANCWMATRFAYWEGPITLTGSHAGEGYLEMTGY